MDARSLLAEARAIYRARAPYMYRTMMRLRLVWAPVGTFGVSAHGHLLIDPDVLIDWAAREGVDAIAGVLAHEVLHVALAHHDRRGDRDPRRWNIAADLYINGLLEEAGWKLPSCGVFPRSFGLAVGLTADEYYDLLPEDAQPTGGPAGGQCGSGAGGEPIDGEPIDGAGGADMVDADGDRIPGLTPQEIEAVGEQLARDIAEQGAKDAGSVPASLARWAGDRLAPSVVDWRSKLRRAVGQTLDREGRGRRAYTRPHRRQGTIGFGQGVPLLPVQRTTRPRVWIAIDTSGSMSCGDIARAVAECVAVVEQRAADVSLLACDAAVRGSVRRVRSASDVGDAIVGGGGTDFVPIFEEVARAEPRDRPSVLVVATDGWGPAPLSPPRGLLVIWLLIGAGAKAPVAWGEQIRVPAAP
jgi:predicted metal-dependent peptidase